MGSGLIVIYRATNIINGKVYIGQTKNLERRILDHKKKNRGTSLISNSIRKYGIHNFKFEIIDYSIFKDVANEMEKYYIKKYNSMKPNGLNITAGGEGSSEMIPWNKGKKNCYSPDQLKNIGKGHAGKHLSESHKKKISDTLSGHPVSAETREKLSKFYSGRSLPESTKQKLRKWRHTEETKRKMREAQKLYRQNKKAFDLTKIAGQAEHMASLEN